MKFTDRLAKRHSLDQISRFTFSKLQAPAELAWKVARLPRRYVSAIGRGINFRPELILSLTDKVRSKNGWLFAILSFFSLSFRDDEVLALSYETSKKSTWTASFPFFFFFSLLFNFVFLSVCNCIVFFHQILLHFSTTLLP
jgi:hypothetical protein